MSDDIGFNRYFKFAWMIDYYIKQDKNLKLTSPITWAMAPRSGMLIV